MCLDTKLYANFSKRSGAVSKHSMRSLSEIQAKNRAVTPLVVKPTNTLYDGTVSTSMKSPHTKMSIYSQKIVDVLRLFYSEIGVIDTRRSAHHD